MKNTVKKFSGIKTGPQAKNLSMKKKFLAERAMAPISIAHPKFRAQLLTEAIPSKYLRRDLATSGGSRPRSCGTTAPCSASSTNARSR
jgi:hypothetical protein